MSSSEWLSEAETPEALRVCAPKPKTFRPSYPCYVELKSLDKAWNKSVMTLKGGEKAEETGACRSEGWWAFFFWLRDPTVGSRETQWVPVLQECLSPSVTSSQAILKHQSYGHLQNTLAPESQLQNDQTSTAMTSFMVIKMYLLTFL